MAKPRERGATQRRKANVQLPRKVIVLGALALALALGPSARAQSTSDAAGHQGGQPSAWALSFTPGRPSYRTGLGSTSWAALTAHGRTRDWKLSKALLAQMPPRMARLVRRLVRRQRQGVAAFDADGTLWRVDVGQEFFRWMVRGRHYSKSEFDGNPGRERAFYGMLQERWRAYRAGTFDGEQMYELMATSMAGMRESTVKDLASRFVRGHRMSIYRPMQLLVRAVDQMGITPWVVSGSPVWVVAAGARELGIPSARVIGLSVEVENGVLTNRIVRPVPWKEGKVSRLLLHTGQRPLLVAGNSHGDHQMLELAEVVRIAINPGRRLRGSALRRGMDIFQFGPNHETRTYNALLLPRQRRASPTKRRSAQKKYFHEAYARFHHTRPARRLPRH